MFRPLIRIRSQRCACAALRVSPASPAFAATYGARYGCPPCGVDGDDVDDRAGRARAAPCRRRPPASGRTGPRRLTAMCWSNSSGVVSSRVPRVVSPAALTRQSIRPNSATVRVTVACACSTSATSACTNRPSPPRRPGRPRRVCRLRRRPVTTTRALADGRPGDRGADALRAAVDQHDLSAKQSAHPRPLSVAVLVLL